MTEISKSQNSKDEKIHKVFEVLDELLPNLGVYFKLMRIVRHQLFEAVFSNEFTGYAGELESSIQRISYYSLYKKIMNKRDENCEALKEQLNEKDEE